MLEVLQPGQLIRGMLHDVLSHLAVQLGHDLVQLLTSKEAHLAEGARLPALGVMEAMVGIFSLALYILRLDCASACFGSETSK
jgi:hypothetical protein